MCWTISNGWQSNQQCIMGYVEEISASVVHLFKAHLFNWVLYKPYMRNQIYTLTLQNGDNLNSGLSRQKWTNSNTANVWNMAFLPPICCWSTGMHVRLYAFQHVVLRVQEERERRELAFNTDDQRDLEQVRCHSLWSDIKRWCGVPAEAYWHNRCSTLYLKNEFVSPQEMFWACAAWRNLPLSCNCNKMSYICCSSKLVCPYSTTICNRSYTVVYFVVVSSTSFPWWSNRENPNPKQQYIDS